MSDVIIIFIFKQEALAFTELSYQALLRHAFQSGVSKEWTSLPQLCRDDLRGQIC